MLRVPKRGGTIDGVRGERLIVLHDHGVRPRGGRAGLRNRDDPKTALTAGGSGWLLRAEFDGRPPERVTAWLSERGVELT